MGFHVTTTNLTAILLNGYQWRNRLNWSKRCSNFIEAKILCSTSPIVVQSHVTLVVQSQPHSIQYKKNCRTDPRRTHTNIPSISILVLCWYFFVSRVSRSAFGWHCPLSRLTQYNITASVKKQYEESSVCTRIHHPDIQTDFSEL